MMKTPRTKKKEKCEAIAVWRLEGTPLASQMGKRTASPTVFASADAKQR